MTDVDILMEVYGWDEQVAVSQLFRFPAACEARILAYNAGYAKGLKGDWAKEVDKAQDEMHNGEVREWAAALERWIERRGLEVPTWSSVED